MLRYRGWLVAPLLALALPAMPAEAQSFLQKHSRRVYGNDALGPTDVAPTDPQSASAPVPQTVPQVTDPGTVYSVAPVPPPPPPYLIYPRRRIFGPRLFMGVQPVPVVPAQPLLGAPGYSTPSSPPATNAPLNSDPLPGSSIPPRAATTAGRIRAEHQLGQGDSWFRKQNYAQAIARYRQAVADAPDYGAPHFRLGFALASTRRYEMAAVEFKKGLELDPSWPQTAKPFEELYGEEQILARESLVSEVLEWHKNAPRDATHNFLAGVMVYFHDGAPAARPYFVAAEQSVGARRWLTAFLPATSASPPVARAPANSEPQRIPRRQPQTITRPAGDSDAPRPEVLESEEPERLPEISVPQRATRPATPPQPLPPPPAAAPKQAPQSEEDSDDNGPALPIPRRNS